MRGGARDGCELSACSSRRARRASSSTRCAALRCALHRTCTALLPHTLLPPTPPPPVHNREDTQPQVAEEAAAPAAAPAPGEPMDINTAVQLVLKKALAHDGLSRGLHEAARAIEKGEAQLCILAEDCNQPDYKKLIEALCGEHNVNLITIPENKQLGEWAGLCKLDAEGTPRKVVGCSCAVVTDFGDESEGLAVLQEYLKGR